MSEKIYFVSNVIFIAVSVVLSICFIGFPKPAHKEMKNYRISLRVLSAAYFAMGVLTALVLIFNLNDNSKEAISFISIVVCSSQALLFSFTLISLLNPVFINLKYIMVQLLPLMLAMMVYFVSFFIWGDPVINSIDAFMSNIQHPSVLARLTMLLLYLFQLCYYSQKFLKEERRYRQQLNNYFADAYHLRLRWVRYAFISALVIGVLALVANFFPYRMTDIILTNIFMPFYLFFAIAYLRYPDIYRVVEPVFVPIAGANEIVADSVANRSWSNFKQSVIDEKYYLRERVNIEEMAHWLGIGRTTLSQHINTSEGMNFNVWINHLRIEEAKQIMKKHPELTILQISEMVGYSEQANFSRQFKIHAGSSPSLWRQKQI